MRRGVVACHIAVASAIVTHAPLAVGAATNGKIAYESGATGWGDIYTANPDGSDAAPIIDPTLAPRPDTDPAWSPDGKKIAYRSMARSGDINIYVIDIDGGGSPQKVTSGNTGDAEPAWSPDGSRIAFNRNNQIYTMNADGSDVRQITNTFNTYYSSPSYSPDGTRIAATKKVGAGDYEIVTMTTDGSGEVAITSNDSDNITNGAPSISPDGSKLVYSSHNWNDDSWAIYEVSATDGSGRRTVVSSSREVGGPTYSPDGTRIAYYLLRGTPGNSLGNDVMHIAADGSGEAVNVTNTDVVSEQDPSWQPYSQSGDCTDCIDIPGTGSGKLSLRLTKPRMKAGQTKRMRARAFGKFIAGFKGEMRNSNGAKALGASLVRTGKSKRGKKAKRCFRFDRPARRAKCKRTTSKGIKLTVDKKRKLVRVRYSPLARIENGKPSYRARERALLRKMKRGKVLKPGAYVLIIKVYLKQNTKKGKPKTKRFRFFFKVRR